jgi:nitrite reductase/ring-hydroxylating ferredoxin subunit
VSERGVRRFVDDLLRGRRPRSFRADESDVAQLRAAIALRAARTGSGAPREEFVTGLQQRLAAEHAADRAEHTAAQTEQALDRAHPGESRPLLHGTRRRFVAAASVAAAAAAVGAGIDHVITTSGPNAGRDTGGAADQVIAPNTGTWRTVAASAELPEGGVAGFDLGSVFGFVARTSGQVAAVSGVCTHQGCRLALDAAARQLNCPCHNAAFAVTGQLLHYQLAAAPRPLPRFEVREVDGMVQVYAPPGPAA